MFHKYFNFQYKMQQALVSLTTRYLRKKEVHFQHMHERVEAVTNF